MKIRLKAFAQFRETIGGERTLDIPDGSGLDSLFEILKAGSDKAGASLFESDGSLRSYVIVMINGKRVDRKAIKETVLHEGDEIALLPPVAGG